MNELDVECVAYCDSANDLPCMCCRLKDEVQRLTSELAERDRRIELALSLHKKRTWPAMTGHVCASCLDVWPCPDVKALKGKSDV